MTAVASAEVFADPWSFQLSTSTGDAAGDNAHGGYKDGNNFRFKEEDHTQTEPSNIHSTISEIKKMTVDLAQQKAEGAVVAAAQKPNSIKEYIDDLKIKTWTEHDWTLMLSAAPVCLELLGSCCLVASTEVARTTKLTPPAGGFKYMKGYNYLNACLVEVSNKGNMSFMLARSNMANIAERSKGAKQSIINIFRELRAKEFDDTVINVELKTLKNIANRCAEDAKAMDMEFTSWLYYIMELHEACQDEESRDTQLFVDILSKEKSQAVYQAAQEEMLKEHQESVKKMEEKVKEAHDMYKELQEKFPTGKDLMIQQLTLIAAEVAAALLKIAGTAAAAYVSPASAFANGAETVKDLSKQGKGDSKPSKDGKEDDKKDNKKDKDNAAADPALARCPLVLAGLETLSEIFDDGVDWERVTGALAEGKDDKKKKEKMEKMDVLGVKEILSKVQKSISKANDEKKSPGGKKLLKIIKETMTVVEGLNAERIKSQDAKKWKKPADDSKIVKTWEKTVNKSLNETIKLQAKSKASSKGTAGRPPTVIKPPETSKEEVQARTDLTKATIENAKAQLKMALDAYVAQQEMVNKMKETTVKLQQDLATVRREISELGQQKITLEEVRRVLRDCIAFLVQLKDQVSKLTRFFNTVSILVDSAKDNQVTPFMELVEKAEDKRIKGNIVRESVINVIQQYALNVGASFSLYEDIADMYKQVNDKHIAPGLTIVDQMGSLTAPEQLEAKKQQLTDYSKSALDGIRAIIQNKTEQVCAGSKARVEELRAALTHPALPPSTRPQDAVAIEEGVAQATRAIEAGIEDGQKPLQYLTQPKEIRDANAQQLANATSVTFQEEEAKRQKEQREEEEAQRLREERESEIATDSDLEY